MTTADIIKEFISAHKDEMVEKLKTLVNLEGYTTEKDNLEIVRDWIKNEFEKEGFVCSTIEVAPDRCGMLTGVLGEDRPGAPILISGHFDTVFPSGTFNGKNPCRIEDGFIYGPGALDMKGGIIIGLYVVKALNHIGYDKHPIKILFCGEEEFDHEGNDSCNIIMEQSRGARCAFNMECAEMGNELSVGQKCQIIFNAEVFGQGGHAGNEFYRGKNALHEAVKMLTEIIDLTDVDKDTTVTASVINAGRHATSIPDYCSFTVDVRANGDDEKERILNRMDEIMNYTHVDGTRTEYSYVICKLPAYTETPEITALLAEVNKAAEECGYPPFGKMVRGGVTDAGNIFMAGVPVLCGCGIRGDYAHNTKEYAVIESLFDRAAIYAQAINNMD